MNLTIFVVYQVDVAGRVVKTTERNLDDSTQFYPPTEDYFSGDSGLEKRVRNAGSTDPVEVKNYYIRSSILNKVISEADKTGRKLKTFVPANGTTLATQTLYYTGQTPTESLTFIHTDASGTGAQQTTASGALIGSTTHSRTGEYSPMGRNIADAGPYISLDTYEEPGQNGIDLFGSGEGYRPGQNTYTLEGMRVSAAHFMAETVNSGRTGGMFGLMQIAFRMSNREKGRWYRTTTQSISSTGVDIDIRDDDGTLISSQLGLTSAPQIRIQIQLLDIVYFDTGWETLLRSLQTNILERRLTTEEFDDLKTDLETLTKDKLCGKFLELVANQVEGITGVPKFEGNIVENLDRIWQEGDLNMASSNASYRGQYHENIIRINEKHFHSRSDKKFKEITINDGNRKNHVLRYTERHDTLFILIHELFHAYLPPTRNPDGSMKDKLAVSHQQMASYALNALEQLGIEPILTNAEHGSRASATFGAALRQACKDVKLGE